MTIRSICKLAEESAESEPVQSGMTIWLIYKLADESAESGTEQGAAAFRGLRLFQSSSRT